MRNMLQCATRDTIESYIFGHNCKKWITIHAITYYTKINKLCVGIKIL